MVCTKYGEFIRILRIKHNEVMGDLTKILNASLPFISAVENGKKNIPESWFAILVDHYNLNEEETRELKVAIKESKTQIKINLIDATKIQRKMAYQFARSFENIDKETAEKITELLMKGNS